MFFILTSRVPSVNKADLTLVGPTVTRLVPDPLAVLSLDNQLFMNDPQKSQINKHLAISSSAVNVAVCVTDVFICVLLSTLMIVSLTFSFAFLQHERAHRGDKRYTCGFCHKPFMTNQQRANHERTHTGEKPYQVIIQGFSINYELKLDSTSS